MLIQHFEVFFVFMKTVNTEYVLQKNGRAGRHQQLDLNEIAVMKVFSCGTHFGSHIVHHTHMSHATALTDVATCSLAQVCAEKSTAITRHPRVPSNVKLSNNVRLTTKVIQQKEDLKNITVGSCSTVGSGASTGVGLRSGSFAHHGLLRGGATHGFQEISSSMSGIQISHRETFSGSRDSQAKTVLDDLENRMPREVRPSI